MTATAQNAHPYLRPRLTAATALALSAGLLLTACGAGGTAEDATPETTRPTVTSTSTAAPADGAASSDAATATDRTATDEPSASPTDRTAAPGETADENGGAALGQPTTEVKQASHAGSFDLQVSDVRVGAHDGFDRVVFEFTGDGQPGWYAHSTPEPRAQGSGHLIDHPGSHAINVLIHGTPYPFDLGIPEEQWPETGPVAGGANMVRGVGFHGIYEATSQYVIGLEDESAFSVTLLQEPTRLVVDVQQ